MKRSNNGTGASGGRQSDGAVWWATGGSGATGFSTDAAYDSAGFDTGTNGTGGMLNINPIVSTIDGSALKIACDPGTLAVSGAPKTAQCYVELPDGSRATDVVWNTDDTRVGSIGQDGLFRANGFVGGVVKITGLIAGNTRATIEVTVDVLIQSNTGGVAAADIAKLAAGGTADAQFKWLYPYDRTVFPRGLKAPVLQFAGGCADSTYLKITLPHFTYEQAATGSSPLQVTFPDDIWKGAQLSTTGSDLMNVSVSKLCAGQVTGPATEQWITAPGKLKGIVYYTTYRPTIEAVRLRLGYTSESFIPNCGAACHSVSANGEVLANATGTWDLTTGSVPPPLITTGAPDELFSFAGMTPDGKRALTGGNGWDTGGSAVKYAGSSAFVSTADSSVILGGLPGYDVPSFSPDSKYVAFSDTYASPKQLSVMNFDGGTGFSNSRVVTVDTTTFVTWPSFLPDSLGVVFHRGNNYLTGNKTSGVNVDLHLVEVNSASEGTVSTLGLLNGYSPDGTFYLPYGEAQEAHKDFQPSVLPRPIGGYFWVMFPTRRAYGNTLAPGGTAGGTTATSPERKKCWVSAIDIAHQGEADPSHPAFYLDGQAFNADTNRPFVALEPCHPDGAPCESGADCCSGFCRETSRAADGTPILQCVPPPPGACANVDEACVTVADCCDPNNLCIAGRCAIPTPPIF